MSPFIARLLGNLRPKEGGYSNNPNDRGGETIWGVSLATARRYGYTGPMRDMTPAQADAIYLRGFIVEPGVDRVAEVSEPIAEELFDAGVNMGPAHGAIFLQRALNAFNLRGRVYPDLRVDGQVGEVTIAALRAYFAWRGRDAQPVLLAAVKALRGAAYIQDAERNQTQEDFVWGWIRKRVAGLP